MGGCGGRSELSGGYGHDRPGLASQQWKFIAQIERGHKARLTFVRPWAQEPACPWPMCEWGGCSPRRQRKEIDCVLPVKMEHLLCAPEGDQLKDLGTRRTGARGGLADGWPQAVPLICLLSPIFSVFTVFSFKKKKTTTKRWGKKPLKRTKKEKKNPAQNRRWILFL